MEDQPADPGDLITGDAETTEATDVGVSKEPASATTSRRRWFSLRRKPKTVDTEPPAEQEAQTDEATPPPRMPVGKAARTTKAQETAAEQPAQEAAEVADPEVTEAVEPQQAAAEPIMVPHRPAGRRLRIGALAAGVLFVAAAAFAGATLQPYLADRAAVDIKLDVAQTAADAITTLWTYTPDNMDSLPDRSAAYLGGDFAHEYRKYIDAIVASNKQAEVTNTTQVMGAAVESVGPSEATAIVYTNSIATSPMTKNIPSLRYLSYRLTMERQDAKWLITRMSTVTSLDLTPQL